MACDSSVSSRRGWPLELALLSPSGLHPADLARFAERGSGHRCPTDIFHWPCLRQVCPEQQKPAHTLTVGRLCDASMYAAKAVLLPQATWSGTHSILQLSAEVKPQISLTVSALGADCLRQHLPHKLYAFGAHCRCISGDNTWHNLGDQTRYILTRLMTGYHCKLDGQILDLTLPTRVTTWASIRWVRTTQLAHGTRFNVFLVSGHEFIRG
jgi:hypothetical protein